MASSTRPRGRSGTAGRAEPSASPYLAPPGGRPSAAPSSSSAPSSSVKASISYCVRALRAMGVGAGGQPALSAELLRQAKFDAPEAAPALRRALHDLALLRLAGNPANSAAALDSFWAAAAPRFPAITEGELPPPAALLLHDCLHAWRCPLAELLLGGSGGAGPTSSRLLLLALGWLAADSGVLQLAVQRQAQRGATQQPPALLPPWPDDASGLPEALAAGQAAAAAASAFSDELMDRARRSHGGWAAVEARQHAALTLLGRVRAAAMALGAAQVARRRRAAAAYGLQARLAEDLGRPAPRPPLSPFELSLALEPAHAMRAAEAAEAAGTAAAEAAAGASHCEAFFTWLVSVREEHFAARRSAAERPPDPEPQPELLAANCAASLAELETGVLVRQEPLGGAVAQALGVLEALTGPGSKPTPEASGTSSSLGISQRIRAVHLALASSNSGPGGSVALAELDAPLPAKLAAEAAEAKAASVAPTQLAPRTLAHIPEGAASGSGAAQLAVADELAALRAANLAAARQLAHLRAGAKRSVRQAAASLGGPHELAYQL